MGKWCWWVSVMGLGACGPSTSVGLIRLATAVPVGVEAIPALPAALGLTAADHDGVVEFSGFGLTENGTDGVGDEEAGDNGGLLWPRPLP